jgi:hypothetical protein
MKASKHEDDNLFKDPGIQYQKETITENITLLDYFRHGRERNAI